MNKWTLLAAIAVLTAVTVKYFVHSPPHLEQPALSNRESKFAVEEVEEYEIDESASLQAGSTADQADVTDGLLTPISSSGTSLKIAPAIETIDEADDLGEILEVPIDANEAPDTPLPIQGQ